MIDDGRSFQHTAEALGGAFIAFGKDPACLNPFAMIDSGTANHDGDYREECFAMLAGVVGRMCRRRGSIDDIEAALIDGAIAAAWDEAGNAGRSRHRAQHISTRATTAGRRTWATALGPWCPGGASGKRLFAGSGVPDLENALTVFELAELKGRGDVQGVVLMLVVFLATQRMYHGPRTRAKAIVIDEAWDLLSGEDSKAFLEGAARRARKYRGALVTGTQSVNDYYANPAARAAWENSDWTDFSGPEGRVRRAAPRGREAHPLRPRHGAGAEEPDHCRRADMPSWCCTVPTAGGSRGSCSTPGRWRCSRRAAPPSPPSRPSRLEGLTTVEAIDRIAGVAPHAGDVRSSLPGTVPLRNDARRAGDAPPGGGGTGEPTETGESA